MIQDISMAASAEASGRASARRNSKSTDSAKIRLLDGAVKINDKLYSLHSGVQIWKRRGVDKLIVRVFLLMVPRRPNPTRLLPTVLNRPMNRLS